MAEQQESDRWAKKNFDAHKEEAKALEFLTDRAEGTHDVAGGEYTEKTPEAAMPHLKVAAEAMQSQMDSKAKEDAVVVTENLGSLRQEASEDMTQDVLQEYREKADRYHNYAKGSALEDSYKWQMDDYASRHSDVLDEETRQKIEREAQG